MFHLIRSRYFQVLLVLSGDFIFEKRVVISVLRAFRTFLDGFSIGRTYFRVFFLFLYSTVFIEIKPSDGLMVCLHLTLLRLQILSIGLLQILIFL